MASGPGSVELEDIKFLWQVCTVKCHLVRFNISPYLYTLGWAWQFWELRSPAPTSGEKLMSAIVRAEGEKRKIMTITITSVSTVLYSLYRMVLCRTCGHP